MPNGDLEVTKTNGFYADKLMTYYLEVTFANSESETPVESDHDCV
jgi:hypothetical protein